MEKLMFEYGDTYNAIETINTDDIVNRENAYPTSRVLDGSQDHGYAEEWIEDAKLSDGREVQIVYLFDSNDITDDDGNDLDAEDYPWDDAHVARIIIDK